MRLSVILRLMTSSITIEICVTIFFLFNLTTLNLYMQPQNLDVLFVDHISNLQWTTGACKYILNYECMLNSAKVKVDKKGILWLQWNKYYKFLF